MLYFATADIATRKNRWDNSVAVRMPGPPLWCLVLDEVADAFTERWRRITARLRR